MTDTYRWGIPQQSLQIILYATAFRAVLALILPLTPQEAYYWSWAQELDLSYFDHPPLASYTIWLTTLVFGQTIFGVKAAAVLWFLALNLIWAKLVQEIYGSDLQTRWTLLALNATIAFQLYGFVITPDTPLIVTWTALVYALWKLIQTDDPRYWYLAGLFLGLAWLGKYSGIMLVPSIFLFLLLSKTQRKWLMTPHPYLAAVLALLVFSPVLIWNAQHDWVSFAFQGSRRTSSMDQWQLRFVGELFGSQFFMLTPYLFYLTFATLVRQLRNLFRSMQDADLLLLSSGLVTTLFFVAVSFRSLVKMNWLVPAYWSLIILGVHYALADPKRFKRFRIGVVSSYAFLSLGIAVVAIPNVPLGEGNTWSGWKTAALRTQALSDSLSSTGSEPFIFSTNYKASSLLKFYLPDHPRTYAQDIIGKPALQFDIWPKAEELKGRSALLVVDDRREYKFKRKKIEPFFQSVERLERIQIENFGDKVRRIDIYLCKNYQGVTHD